MILTGIGTLLTKGPQQGTGGAVRNPIAPWNVVYGRTVVPGTINYIEETGDENKFLHLVITLACHPCEAVDGVLVDGNRVFFDSNGNSFTRDQQFYTITSITRADNLVTCIVTPDLASDGQGAKMNIHDVGDQTFNGQFDITQVNANTFSYLCGGNPGTSSGGVAILIFANYHRNIHFEYLLGDHVSTFPGLLATSQGRWTGDHLCSGRTVAYIRLEWDEEIFTNGVPQLKFLVRGKNDIFDPRTSPPTIEYSENPALCIADYLAHKTLGFKANYGTEIPLASLISAANVCDELVTLANGEVERRYTLNGGFPVTLTRGAVIQNLLTSCAGRLSYRGGQFIIAPAFWPGVSIDIGNDGDATATNVALKHASSNFQWRPKLAGRDRYNGVKGVYVSPVNNWQPTDLVPYAQDSGHGYTNGPPEYNYDQNLADDLGERRWLDVQLPFTTSPTMAQRICKIELLRRRQQGTGTFAFDLFMYQGTAFDVLRFTLPALSWEEKLVEITAHRFVQSKQTNSDGSEVTLLGTEIDIQETDPSIYDWDSTEEERAPAGFQYATMPNNQSPASPSNIYVTSGATGSIPPTTHPVIGALLNGGGNTGQFFAPAPTPEDLPGPRADEIPGSPPYDVELSSVFGGITPVRLAGFSMKGVIYPAHDVVTHTDPPPHPGDVTFSGDIVSVDTLVSVPFSAVAHATADTFIVVGDPIDQTVGGGSLFIGVTSASPAGNQAVTDASMVITPSCVATVPNLFGMMLEVIGESLTLVGTPPTLTMTFRLAEYTNDGSGEAILPSDISLDVAGHTLTTDSPSVTLTVDTTFALGARTLAPFNPETTTYLTVTFPGATDTPIGDIP